MDASFMLEMLLGDEFSQPAEDAYRRWISEPRPILAPSLFYPEVTSAIRKRVHRRMIMPSDAPVLLDEALDWNITIWEDVRLVQPSTLEFAMRFNRPKAYDAQYLALADLLGCELWTADRRLVNAVAGQLPWVRWIGEAV